MKFAKLVLAFLPVLCVMPTFTYRCRGGSCHYGCRRVVAKKAANKICVACKGGSCRIK